MKIKRIHKKEDTTCDICNEVYSVSKTNLNTTLLKFGRYRCRKCSYNKKSEDSTHFKGTPIHNSFAGAKQRCNYKNHTQYQNYGGRGIKFLWENFNDFYADMFPTWFEGGTLERLDVNGHYCKENCTWVPRQDQGRNTTKNIHNKEQITKIREMYATGNYSQKELAKMFKDSPGNISNIVNKRRWNF
jgi:hypothetical protein